MEVYIGAGSKHFLKEEFIIERLSEEQINGRIQKLDGWSLTDEKWIVKKYRFKDYLDGVAFVNEVAYLSENEQHHPLISIDYKLVTIKLSSWQANGLTELDFKMAEQYDRKHSKQG